MIFKRIWWYLTGRCANCGKEPLLPNICYGVRCFADYYFRNK